MYNKYFTMKRSELKEAIKAEIKSVLSEEITEAKFIKFKGDSDDNKMEVEAEREMNTPDGELKVYTVKTDDGVQSYTADQVEVVNEIAPMGPGQTTTLADFEEEEEVKVNNSKKIENPVEELFFHADSYKKNMIEMEDVKQAFEEILRDYKDEIIANRSVTFSDIREKEMTDAEKKKAAEKDAKKEKDFANKQKEVDKLKKELADNKDELVKIAKISRNERTKAQQNLLDDMAKKTKELKKLKRVEI